MILDDIYPSIVVGSERHSMAAQLSGSNTSSGTTVSQASHFMTSPTGHRAGSMSAPPRGADATTGTGSTISRKKKGCLAPAPATGLETHAQSLKSPDYRTDTQHRHFWISGVTIRSCRGKPVYTIARSRDGDGAGFSGWSTLTILCGKPNCRGPATVRSSNAANAATQRAVRLAHGRAFPPGRTPKQQ